MTGAIYKDPPSQDPKDALFKNKGVLFRYALLEYFQKGCLKGGLNKSLLPIFHHSKRNYTQLISFCLMHLK